MNLTRPKTLKGLACLVFLTWCIAFSNATAQVVINEIFPAERQVELKNIGNTTIDVADYQLCLRPSYLRLGSASVICGDVNMEPGAILTVTFSAVNSTLQGEVGLYTNGAFSNPNSIVDYVQWGTAGGGRSATAVEAGIWSQGDVVPAFAGNSSIAYDGNGEASSDWNEFTSPTICDENEVAVCDVDGGTITANSSTDLCLNDEAGAGAISFGVSGSRGDARAWIATDVAGEIVINQQTNQYDFTGFADGTYTVYYMRWEAGNFGGLSVGNNLTDLTGCFDLSNGIDVTVFNVNGGVISTEDETTICLDDNKSDVLTFGVSGSAGNARAWIATDENDEIVINQQTNQFDFSGAVAGVCVVYYMRWEAGNFGGLAIGNNLTDLTGCFDLSNGIEVERLEGEACDAVCDVDGGTITANSSTDLCLNDEAGAGAISFGVSGSRGDARAWIATDATGEIVINQQTNQYDFTGFADGTYTVYYMRWEAGNFGGLSVGNNLTDLTGCFDLSNGIDVTVFNVNGGVISTEDETTICLDDNKSDVLTFGVSGSAGNARAWIATDENGEIVINQQTNQFDFSGAGAGVCVVYYMRWEAGNFGGLSVGNNLTDLTGCFDLSNGIAVTRLEDCDEEEEIEVVAFYLIDAIKNEVIQEIKEGDQIDLGEIGTNFLSIQAITNPEEVGSVRMVLRGTLNTVKTENFAPYTLFGDNRDNGDITGSRFRSGNYKIEATPFEKANLKGERGDKTTVSFELVKKEDLVRLDIITVGKGRVLIAPKKDGYRKGSIIKLIAIADRGYRFFGWTDTNDRLLSRSPGVLVYLARDIALKAVFVKKGETFVAHPSSAQKSGSGITIVEEFFPTMVDASLYPNPIISDVVNVSLSETIYSETIMSVMDITGRVLFTQEFDQIDANQNIELDLSGLNLKEGMYLLQITAADHAPITKQFIKQ